MRKLLLIVPVAAFLIAQDVPPPNPRNVAAAEKEAIRILLLMDRDQNGKVSKAEFMAFMEAEFERLDKNKDGELDVKELTGSSLQFHNGPHR